MAPRGYPAEFRRRVIELVDAGRPVAVVAAELGISDQSIYSWRRQARIEEVSDASLSSVLSGGGREVRFSGLFVSPHSADDAVGEVSFVGSAGFASCLAF